MEAERKPVTKFFGWRVVFASFVGLAVGVPAIIIFTLGVFTKPIEDETGWTRAQVSAVAAIYTLVTMLVAPFQGALLDRFGPRRVALVAAPLFALVLASLHFVPKDDIRVFYATWVVISLLGAGIFNTTFNKPVAAWFDRRLGLAIGVAVTGQGVGAALLPLLSQRLIAHLGWRLAYVVLAVLSCTAISLVSFFFLYDTPAKKGQHVDGDVADKVRRTDGGVSLRDAARTSTFWWIAAAFLFLGVMTSAMMTHQVPMLIEAGRTQEKAAIVQGTFGLAIIAGRLAVGWLIDRFFAPRVLIVTLVGVVIGLTLYARGAMAETAFLSALLIGFGLGAEIDVLGFLIPRYFGRKSYGNIYGAILSAFQLGAAIGAALLGVIRTKQGSYTVGLWIVTFGTLVAIAILTRLPRYEATKLRPSSLA